jgi:hypothetical protein
MTVLQGAVGAVLLLPGDGVEASRGPTVQESTTVPFAPGSNREPCHKRRAVILDPEGGRRARLGLITTHCRYSERRLWGGEHHPPPLAPRRRQMRIIGNFGQY